MFRPARFLGNAHLQTVWGRLIRSRRAVQTQREVLETPDDDEVVLDHLQGSATSPRVILLHGLEGSSNSVYIQGILSLLAERGVAATVLNFRACARHPASMRRTIPNRGRRLYHSGETSDLDFVVEVLRQREPQRPLLGFGASLGGNVLLKWLGERGASSPIIRASTLSVPYDLAAGSRYLEEGLSRLYVRGFLRSLNDKAKALTSAHPHLHAHVDLERARRARTFFEYDDAVTAPLHGFAGANDYYERSSSINFVERIAVPTLCISAEDDPFLPPAILNQVQRRASPSVKFIITRQGGHVGFIAGSILRPKYWAEESVVDFLLSR